MPGKQAKVVTPPMLKRMVSFPARDRAMILLSVKAGPARLRDRRPWEKQRQPSPGVHYSRRWNELEYTAIQYLRGRGPARDRYEWRADILYSWQQPSVQDYWDRDCCCAN